MLAWVIHGFSYIVWDKSKNNLANVRGGGGGGGGGIRVIREECYSEIWGPFY